MYEANKCLARVLSLQSIPSMHNATAHSTANDRQGPSKIQVQEDNLSMHNNNYDSNHRTMCTLELPIHTQVVESPI